jgi:hypothetical protein
MSKDTFSCVFKTNNSNANLHSVAFNNITSGEVMALIHALQIAKTVSTVADDLYMYLKNALYKANTNGLTKKFLDEIDCELDIEVKSKTK